MLVDLCISCKSAKPIQADNTGWMGGDWGKSCNLCGGPIRLCERKDIDVVYERENRDNL
jgi:hypothetical protein